MDDNKANLLFISVLTCATLGTLGGMQKHELGWIVLRWSRFLRQAVKVDLMTKRMIHHEDTQAVHG